MAQCTDVIAADTYRVFVLCLATIGQTAVPHALLGLGSVPNPKTG